MSANLENSAVATGLEKVSFHANPKEPVKLLSPVQLFATPWTAANQAPPSMGFSRQEYWSGVPLPSPQEYTELYKKDLHDPDNHKGVIIHLEPDILEQNASGP